MGAKVSKTLPRFYKCNKERENNIYLTPRSHFGETNDNNYDSDKGFDDSLTFICEFCLERKPLDDSFNVKGCTHFYCTQCTVRYVTSRLDENLLFISCPISNCKGVLDIDYCRVILPNDVFDRWGAALCESVIDSSHRFYCPYKACSALLIKDVSGMIERGECPHCKRAFCVKCKAPWHHDLDCKNFQKLKTQGEDSLLVDLANRKKWMRCPQCNIYAEKISGCNFIACRCGIAFCYNCGGRFREKGHSCPRCKK